MVMEQKGICIRPLGDSALVLQLDCEINPVLHKRIVNLANVIESDPFIGFVEAVPSYNSVTVFYNPIKVRSELHSKKSAFEKVSTHMYRYMEKIEDGNVLNERLIEIPVVYGEEFGPDLEYVAKYNKITPEKVIELHSKIDYLVYMIGFAPGFPYLGGIDKQIATPRKEKPRPAIPAGSVGIAGEQTGIYPLETPGGWQVIGKTPVDLFTPNTSPPTLLQSGDVIRFMPITEDEFVSYKEKKAMSVEILQPGFLSTVQDLGRYGSQKYGVIVGGAMDSFSLRVANLLVGNDEREAAIEVTMYGTELTFNKDYLIAITGGDLNPMIDGENVPMWRPIYIKKGEVLTFKSPRSGCRAYLAVAGGIQVPKVMGSRSTYIRAGIGGYKGRELQKGDILTCKELNDESKSLINHLKEKRTHVSWSVNYSSFYTFHNKQTIRMIKGAEFHRFDEVSQQAIVNEPYALTVNADRMGYQLEGTKLALLHTFELLSEGVTYGTIQVPENGQPIVLMADRQTTGGYPKIGQVISADLPRLAQLHPGGKINFEIITIDEAENLLIKQERDIHELKMGTYDKNGALVVEAGGGTPHPLPFSEVYSSLSTGVIDSVLTSTPTAVDASFWEVLDFYSPVSVTMATNFVTVNLDEFNKLDEATQEAIIQAGKEMEEKVWEDVAALDKEQESISNENGITTLEPSAEFLQELADLTEDIRQEWLETAPDAAKEIVEKFNQEVGR